jgi:hypothetical protein
LRADALRRPSIVALAYAAITVVMTWPIAASLDRDIPSDLGDPAFVAGILAWGGEHWLALFSGDLGAVRRFWNAPIFYPEPLALAYSEHFALHSLLTLPVYAATRNPVLCYNLAFLATFVVGALGMYLLVRELTGQRDRFSGAAFVAGLAFAFAPYRVATLPHLQVLSSQWMPYVLLGLHRYFRSQSSDGLVGAGAALWAQNLSSGYYMLFFGPFVALYALVEIAVKRAWRRFSVWRDLALLAAVSLAATLPFALPYLERTRGSRRTLTEVILFSADLEAWLTASPLMNVWGGLQTLPKAEGFLFPGVTVVVLAFLALVRGRRSSSAGTMFGGAALVLSFWLALGPQIQLDTQPVAFPALYRPLWEFVPGFNAARVPARFAMMTVLALALLAGVFLSTLRHRAAGWMVALCAVLVVVEGAAMPLPVNTVWTSTPEETVAAPSPLHRSRDAPEVYRYLAGLKEGSVAAHFPFGLPEREIQYGYYAMLHGTRTINGYSGTFPATYNARLGILRNPFADPGAVAMVLKLDAVTHVVVHTEAYTQGRGMAVVELLEKIGWKQVARFDGDHVLSR